MKRIEVGVIVGLIVTIGIFANGPDVHPLVRLIPWLMCGLMAVAVGWSNRARLPHVPILLTASGLVILAALGDGFLPSSLAQTVVVSGAATLSAMLACLSGGAIDREHGDDIKTVLRRILVGSSAWAIVQTSMTIAWLLVEPIDSLSFRGAAMAAVLASCLQTSRAITERRQLNLAAPMQSVV